MYGSPKNLDQKFSNKQQIVMLLESIQRGQEPLWNDPRRGLNIEIPDQEQMKAVQLESLNQNIPVSRILNSSSYDLEVLKKAVTLLVYEAVELEIDPSTDPIKIVNQIFEVLPEIIDNVLKQNHQYFDTLGEEISVSPLMLSMIGGALVQPSLIYLASRCVPQYLDAWESKECPVCGRLPSVVIKSESEVWRFKCSYCRAEYKMDVFSCPSCGISGEGEKEFLLVGDNQEFELVGCPECRRYYKIINIAKLKEQIPEGLEDPYTEILDEVALEKGFIRLDEDPA
jgi:formate dehydrogenase maturation protein FdhE